jgi:hypothetical protein
MSKHIERDQATHIPVQYEADTVDTTVETKRFRRVIGATLTAAAVIGGFAGLQQREARDAQEMQANHRANILRTEEAHIEDRVISLQAGAKLLVTPIEQGEGNPVDGDPTSNVASIVPDGYKLAIRQPETFTKYRGYGACYFGDKLPQTEEERISHTYFFNLDAESSAGRATEEPYQGDPKAGYRQGTINVEDTQLSTDPSAPVAICALYPANQPIPQSFMQNGELPKHS